MIDERLVVIVAGVLGAMVGSFLNVCIYRWPNDLSVVKPRSRCGECGRTIVWYDNIPIISWLLLRGRCRWCGARVSIQYPLVELATALVWAGWLPRSFPSGLQALRGVLHHPPRHHALTDRDRHHSDGVQSGRLGSGPAPSVLLRDFPRFFSRCSVPWWDLPSCGSWVLPEPGSSRRTRWAEGTSR